MTALTWHETGMGATVAFDVAVVRSARRHRCHDCRNRRVCFALTVTSSPLGNPVSEWKCAKCWGLRR